MGIKINLSLGDIEEQIDNLDIISDHETTEENETTFVGGLKQIEEHYFAKHPIELDMQNPSKTIAKLQRKLNVIQASIYTICIAIIVVCIIFSGISGLTALAIVGAVSFIFLFYILKITPMKKQVNQLFRERYAIEYVRNHFPSLTMLPEQSISLEDYNASGLTSDGKKAVGNDCFIGKNFKFSEIKVTCVIHRRKGRSTIITLFRGVFAKIELKEPVLGVTRIHSHPLAQANFSDTSFHTTANNFNAYSSSQADFEAALPQLQLDCLTEYAKKTTVYAAAKDKFLYLAFPLQKDLFEVGKVKSEQAIYQQLDEEISAFSEIATIIQTIADRQFD